MPIEMGSKLNLGNLTTKNMNKKLRGRPGKYKKYEELMGSLPAQMRKRPIYLDGIGLFRGQRGITAWIKLTLPHGGIYQGKAYQAGASIEIKLGNLSSWSWAQIDARRTELLGRAERGEPLEDTPITCFKTYANEWLQDRKGVVKAWIIERGHLENSLLPFFGDKDLKSITVQDINKWQAKQLEKLAPATVQRQLNTLKTILNGAKRGGQIIRSPAEGAQRIRGIESRQRYLELGEASKLVTEASNVSEWLSDFLLWLLHSGMRRGEVLNLTWQDVRVHTDGPSVVSITRTKSGQPRYVTCTADMVAILDRQKNRCVPGDERVFPISLTTLKRKMKLLLKRTELHNVRLHDMRRTHATHLTREGVDLRTVAGRIGHADLSMLQRVYAVFDRDEEAAKTAQHIFGGIGQDELTGMPPSPDT